MKILNYLHEKFKQEFGRYYFLYLFALIAIIFWPVVVFQKSIQFDTSQFTTEWIKIGIVSLLVALLLKVFANIKNRIILKKNILQIIDYKYKDIINNIIKKLETYVDCLKKNSLVEENRKELYNLWFQYKLNFEVKEIRLIIKEEKIINKIILLKNTNIFKKYDNYFEDILEQDKYKYINDDEYKELLKYLSNIYKELDNIKEYIKNNF